MLRSVTLGVALSVLAAACALIEPPVPPIQVQVQVRNARAHPVALEVRTPAGVLPGAVQPASLPINAMTNVTFDVPITGPWSIVVDGEEVPDVDVNEYLADQKCAFGIELDADGSYGYGCGMFTAP